MTIIRRTLSNSGDPIANPDGIPYPEGTKIYFTLVDASLHRPVSLFDAVNGDYIVSGPSSASLDAAGEFEIDLWPNNRGQSSTVYLVSLPFKSFVPFYIIVEEGFGTLSLINARAAMETMTPQEISWFTDALGSIQQSEATATAAAGTATTKAAEALASANSAAGSADTATTKAAESLSSANSAAGSADTATTKAGEALASASSAAGSADTATTKAVEAAASADASAAALITVAYNLIRTQAIVAQHHAFN